MRKALVVLAIAAVATLTPLSASAAGRRVVVVRPYFGWCSPFIGPYWGWGWGPYWDPFYTAYPNTGTIKLDTKVNDAHVFIDGGYLGTTHDHKTIHLRPGGYTIEIQVGGQTAYTQKVFVVAGKTLKLRPELSPTAEAAPRK